MRDVMDLHSLGREIRRQRDAAGLTQEQLAAMALVSRPTIARLETGRASDLGYRSIVRILNALGLDLRVSTLNRGRPTLEDLEAEQA
jgi:transcriptional regulator with XRE-family HTH domain